MQSSNTYYRYKHLLNGFITFARVGWSWCISGTRNANRQSGLASAEVHSTPMIHAGYTTIVLLILLCSHSVTFIMGKYISSMDSFYRFITWLVAAVACNKSQTLPGVFRMFDVSHAHMSTPPFSTWEYRLMKLVWGLNYEQVHLAST